MIARGEHGVGHFRGQAMKAIWNLLRKAGMFILIVAVVLLLLAERFQETPFMNFLRSLI
jgi:hypothetical protein